MKIIVFGGAGFLGSHVADTLTSRGHDVTVFDLKKSAYLKKGQACIVGDIMDVDLVEKSMRGREVVYNFAGIADLDKAKLDPLSTIKNNIIGNAVLLDASRKHEIKRFIFASTLYVYSKAGSFYRGSKQACELLIENYNEVYNLDFTILRFGSLYGPRADETNWIYRILKQALTEKKIVRYGDGKELREYIHVYDAARLSADVLSEEYTNQHVIISGNQQIKIKDLLVMIKEILNNKIELEFRPVANVEHYEITPYNFNPKIAKKIQGNHYVDLGQGIFNLTAEIYKECFGPEEGAEIYK